MGQFDSIGDSLTIANSTIDISSVINDGFYNMNPRLTLLNCTLYRAPIDNLNGTLLIGSSILSSASVHSFAGKITDSLGFNLSTDPHGASNPCVALVVVQDRTPPLFTVLSDITVNAKSPEGARVMFNPTAYDECSGPPVVVCVPPSGHLVPIGSTAVMCTATDLVGNSSKRHFQVAVLGPAK